MILYGWFGVASAGLFRRAPPDADDTYRYALRLSFVAPAAPSPDSLPGVFLSRPPGAPDDDADGPVVGRCPKADGDQMFVVTLCPAP